MTLLKIITVLLAPVVFLMGYAHMLGASAGPEVEPARVAPAPPVFDINADIVWGEIQRWRMDAGYAPYQHDPQACELAEKRLEEIPTDWSHDGFWDEVCISCSTWGENLAKGFTDEREMLAGWLASPTHRKNLEDPYFTHGCIATNSNHTVHFFISY